MYNLIRYRTVQTRDITFILFHPNLDLENTTTNVRNYVRMLLFIVHATVFAKTQKNMTCFSFKIQEVLNKQSKKLSEYRKPWFISGKCTKCRRHVVLQHSRLRQLRET